MKELIKVSCWFLLLSTTLIGQGELPLSIEVNYDLMGDYRNGEILGYHIDVDSLYFKYDEELKAYFSDFTFHERVINGTSFPTMTDSVIFYQNWKEVANAGVREAEIDWLLFFLDSQAYLDTTIVDSFNLDKANFQKILFQGEIYQDFKVEDYLPDSNQLQILHTYLSKSREVEFMDLIKPQDDLIAYISRNWLVSNFNTKVISSYTSDIRVKLNYKDSSIRLHQRYPGGNNCTWTLITDTEKMTVFNPEINSQIHHLLPKRHRSKLKEYRSLEFIIEHYFWNRKW